MEELQIVSCLTCRNLKLSTKTKTVIRLTNKIPKNTNLNCEVNILDNPPIDQILTGTCEHYRSNQ